MITSNEPLSCPIDVEPQALLKASFVIRCDGVVALIIVAVAVAAADCKDGQQGVLVTGLIEVRRCTHVPQIVRSDRPLCSTPPIRYKEDVWGCRVEVELREREAEGQDSERKGRLKSGKMEERASERAG